MFVRIELADATVDFRVANLVEAKRIIASITRLAWLRQFSGFARFDYDGGTKAGCIRRSTVKRVGMLTVDEASKEAARE